MIVLAGIRFVLMAELTKIKTKIDFLLDRYNQISDPHTKSLVEEKLEKQRQQLEEWYKVHGRD